MRRLSKTYIGLVMGVAGLFLIQSCKVGHTYQQPDLKLPHAFRGDSLSVGGDTTSISTISWKAFFQDPTLRALIDSALHNNFEMKTALLNISIANKELQRNKLDYLPQVDLTIASASRQWRSKEYGSGASSKYYAKQGTEPSENMYTYLSQFGTQVGFNWEVDIWGKISHAKERLLAEYLNTNEAKNAVQTKLVADVATGYFNLLMLDAKIEVAKRNVQLNDSTLQMIKLQYKAGEVTSLAIQQTESQRLIAASLVPKLEREIVMQENALRVLTGQMPDKIQRGVNLEALFAENRTISLGSPLDILRNRPDVRRAEFDLIAANAQANIEQAMRYPALTIGGTFGVNAMLPKNWFSIPGALLGGITGELTAPIFKNKTLKTKWEVAKLEREKAELGLQETVVRAVAEVADVVVTVDKLREQLAFARARVSNSGLAVRNANLLFKSGYATYLEVITAQGNALDSDLALVELRQEHLASFVDLYRSLGGGWQ